MMQRKVHINSSETKYRIKTINKLKIKPKPIYKSNNNIERVAEFYDTQVNILDVSLFAVNLL